MQGKAQKRPEKTLSLYLRLILGTEPTTIKKLKTLNINNNNSKTLGKVENLISSPSFGWSARGIYVRPTSLFLSSSFYPGKPGNYACLPHLPEHPRSWSWLQTLDVLRSSGHVFVDHIFKRPTRNINSNLFLLRVTLKENKTQTQHLTQ